MVEKAAFLPLFATNGPPRFKRFKAPDQKNKKEEMNVIQWDFAA